MITNAPKISWNAPKCHLFSVLQVLLRRSEEHTAIEGAVQVYVQLHLPHGLRSSASHPAFGALKSSALSMAPLATH